MPVIRPRVDRAFGTFDPRAEHPRAATAGGLSLLVLLVPVLQHWHGADGPLGQSLPLFFLVPVLLASALGGRSAGVLVSCAAIVAWDWYFIPPRYMVTIASVRDVLALVVFLAVALLVGQISSVARRAVSESLRRARSSEALYDLSMALIARREVADILPQLTRRLLDTFDLEGCAVLLPDRSDVWHTVSSAGHIPTDLHVEESRSFAATVGRVLSSGEERRLGRVQRGPGQSERMILPRAGHERARLLPLRVGANAVGVLEVVPRVNERPDPERERLLTTFANGAAIAIEQARLAEEERAAEVARESDRLKSALLSSVSHDLRTPLAGIKAAASSLLQRDVRWSDADRTAFLTDIDGEADRLTRLVSNLLDLSRIEAGAIRPDTEWEDVGELIDRVHARLASRLADHRIEQLIADGLPAVQLDAVQIEQVLTNLLENAAKYSAEGTTITVRAEIATADRRPSLRISVSDQGIGIAPDEQKRVFDTFYRVTGAAARAGGTGMGLAIVKGLVEAHGGTVEVQSAPGQGSTFVVTLPLAGADADHVGPPGARAFAEPLPT